ncbi:PREDICTED: serine carboxypeptidase-like 45 [Ipomoea nil]|uniref:serine carboxypeptidase-like 45 n=1 Tax=Ipomoea nil TaxID=35883 RepID=UPI000900D2FC|nr:PREDICTED: serine carboxypeptidase-like 45 [Ipomoea nil]
MVFLLWFLLVNTLYSISIRINGEIIDSLPGQPSDVDFNQYSGYIVTHKFRGRALFYYFAEAQSEDKFSMPLTLWLGGGHDCSSAAIGMFYENGPFRPTEDGELVKNQFSWNLASNMLYVDTPIGVAFSYSNTSSDYKIWSDTMTARENLKFLRKWFIEFSEYRDLDFYIAGDSYGGHLAPQLAELILEYNRKPVHVRPIKLKGIALGNPLLEKMGLSNVEHLWHYGIISTELYHLQKRQCDSTRMVQEILSGEMSEDCSDINVMISEEIGDDMHKDNLLFQSCQTDQYSSSQRHCLGTETAKADPCLLTWVDDYLSRPEVQEALHANASTWDSIFHGRNMILNNLAIDILPTLSALLKRGIPLLIYSGDEDLRIPVSHTRELANVLATRLNLTTMEMNEPWYDGKQIGGWSQTFGNSGGGEKVANLTFATVRGGSHFVPNSSPSKALTLFKAFLKGSPPPNTHPDHYLVALPKY